MPRRRHQGDSHQQLTTQNLSAQNRDEKRKDAHPHVELAEKFEQAKIQVEEEFSVCYVR